ncbi:MAG: methylated-DNA--[protein]-cysteine S-methyltransferase [Betaproteobacteria bacterium]|nr:methylated-DNA--[protein]-cysteine S-methyltransferase [Betaproteobacteria bacterium]
MNRSSISICFDLPKTALGLMLVAANPHGVCAIFLGDDPEYLVEALKKRFPKAKIFPADGDDAGFERLLNDVIRLAEHPEAGLEHPLDIHGTVFQQRVWQALREIAPGETVSYSEIARRIGAPRAARAVAGACAANPLAIVVPCHRVVHGDGSLSGYRWGVERKRALLEKEVQRAGKREL